MGKPAEGSKMAPKDHGGAHEAEFHAPETNILLASPACKDPAKTLHRNTGCVEHWDGITQTHL